MIMEIAEENQINKIFIRVLLVLSALLLIFFHMKLQANAEVPLSAVITVSNVQVQLDDEVIIEVGISGNPGIAGHKFIFLYDAETLEYTGGDKSEVGAGNVVLPIYEVNSESDGKIVIVGADVTDSEADGLLFTMKFKITGGLIGNSIDDSSFRLICEDLKNVANADVTSEIEQGSVLILGELGAALNENERYIVGRLNIDNGDKNVYVKVIGKEKITIEDFKHTWGTDIKIEYANGGEVDETIHPLLGTGMKIVKSGEVIAAVVQNDLTGRGAPDIEDAKYFLEFLVGNKILEGAYSVAVNHYKNEMLAVRKLRNFLTSVLSD